MQLFKIPVQYTNAEEKFAYIFFKEELSIIDYKFSQPKKKSVVWTPCLDLLTAYGEMIESYPSTLEDCMSIRVWFNKMFGTNFDVRLSKMGFNYLRKLFNYTNQEIKVFYHMDNFV